MSLRSRLGALRRGALCSFYRRNAYLGNRGPIVSFSFDDFPRTAYSVGASVLEKFGARGTYYTALGLMKTSDQLGAQFHAEDLDSLLDKGHEIGSQTFSHMSCRSASTSEFREDAQRGRKALQEMCGLECANFAYPFGHISLNVKRTIGLDFISCRSNFPGLNGPKIDLNLLRANSLYGGLENFRRAEDLILQSVQRKSWLIFYTHDVRPNPSRYGCTSSLFESTVALASRSGCRILTIREVLAEVGAQETLHSIQGRSVHCLRSGSN